MKTTDIENIEATKTPDLGIVRCLKYNHPTLLRRERQKKLETPVPSWVCQPRIAREEIDKDQNALLLQLCNEIHDLRTHLNEIVVALGDKIGRCDYCGAYVATSDLIGVTAGGKRLSIWLEALEDAYWDESFCAGSDEEMQKFHFVLVNAFMEKVWMMRDRVPLTKDNVRLSALGRIAWHLGYRPGIPFKECGAFYRLLSNRWKQ